MKPLSIQRILIKWLASAAFVAVTTAAMPGIITAQDSTQKNAQSSAQPAANSAEDEVANLRKQVQRLSAEVARLTTKNGVRLDAILRFLFLTGSLLTSDNENRKIAYHQA